METIIRGFWGAREESLEQVANRLALFFTAISKLHTCLSHWTFRSLDSVPGDINLDILRRLLLDCRLSGDDPRRVYYDLGFSVAGHNDSASFHIHCGASAQPSPNRVIFRLYGVPSITGSCTYGRLLLNLLRTIAVEWNISWGDVVNDAVLSADVEDESEIGPALAWFFSSSRGLIKPENGVIISEPVPDRGHLVYGQAIVSDATAKEGSLELLAYIKKAGNVNLKRESK